MKMDPLKIVGKNVILHRSYAIYTLTIKKLHGASRLIQKILLSLKTLLIFAMFGDSYKTLGEFCGSKKHFPQDSDK